MPLWGSKSKCLNCFHTWTVHKRLFCSARLVHIRCSAQPSRVLFICREQLASSLIYLYLFGLWAVKLSVNLLHVHLTAKFPAVQVWAVRSVYAIVTLLFITIILYNFGCYPPSRRWDGLVGNAEPCPAMVKEWDWVNTVTFISL